MQMSASLASHRLVSRQQGMLRKSVSLLESLFSFYDDGGAQYPVILQESSQNFGSERSLYFYLYC